MKGREITGIPVAIAIGTTLHVVITSGIPQQVVVLAAQFAWLALTRFVEGVLRTIFNPDGHALGVGFFVGALVLYWLYQYFERPKPPTRGRTVHRDDESPRPF